MTERDNRMVKITDMWERISAKGAKYYSGYAGPVQYLMFDGGEQPHPTRPEETVHVWRLLVQERDPAKRPAPKPENDRRRSKSAPFYDDTERAIRELVEG